MRFIFSGSSKKNKRPTNQDSFYIKSKKICGIPSVMAVVCDGVGSMRDGELAGIIAVTMLKFWFETKLQKNIAEDKSLKNMNYYLTDAINRINEKIKKVSDSVNVKTASTISVLLIIGTKYFIAHLGDSRIYKINKAGFFQITEDHIIKSDPIKSGQAIKRIRANTLTKYLGYYDGKIDIFYAEGRIQPDDSYIVCSDGFYSKMDGDGLQKKLIKINSASRLLNLIKKQIKIVVKNGGRDNISLALIKIIEY